jgi:hypothetical protein
MNKLANAAQRGAGTVLVLLDGAVMSHIDWAKQSAIDIITLFAIVVAIGVGGLAIRDNAVLKDYKNKQK